jgi:hypothetical protein
MRIPGQIEMGSSSALTGGDLCDASSVEIILREIPTHGSIVTCDAEVATSFTAKKSVQILLAWAAICVRSNSQFRIIKLFKSNAMFVAIQIGVVSAVFRKVKVIVPHFSSREGSEIYVLGCQPRRIISCEEIFRYHKNGDVVPVMQSFPAIIIILRTLTANLVSPKDNYFIRLSRFRPLTTLGVWVCTRSHHVLFPGFVFKFLVVRFVLC